MNDFIPKTGNIDKAALINGDTKPKKPVSKGDGTFDHILTKQIRENSSEGPSKISTALPEIQSPVKMPSISPSLDMAQYTGKIENSLDLLETYAAFLNDPQKTLKQANDILEQVLQQTRLLALEFEKSPPENPDLTQLLAHLLSTTEVEKIKFDRGDYAS